METYNQLRFLTCDRYFRTVTDVELKISHARVTNSNRRRLVDLFDTTEFSANSSDVNQSIPFDVNSTINAPLQELVAASFSVMGECRSCPVSDSGTFHLFDETFRVLSQHFFSRSHTLSTRVTRVTNVCLVYQFSA